MFQRDLNPRPEVARLIMCFCAALIWSSVFELTLFIEKSQEKSQHPGSWNEFWGYNVFVLSGRKKKSSYRLPVQFTTPNLSSVGILILENRLLQIMTLPVFSDPCTEHVFQVWFKSIHIANHELQLFE